VGLGAAVERSRCGEALVAEAQEELDRAEQSVADAQATAQAAEFRAQQAEDRLAAEAESSAEAAAALEARCSRLP